jgi:hypothetical protein
MSEDAFYAPNRPPPAPRQPLPGEHVWTLRKGHQTIRCELRTHGHGVEAQLLRDNAFYAGRLFKQRAHALAHAAECRADLQAEGWLERKPDAAM